MDHRETQTPYHSRHAAADASIYKLLIENIQDYAIFFMDPGGIIRTWNKGAERAKGYTEDDIIGKHFSIFYSQDDVDAGKPERELRIATKLGRIEDEDWRIRKDGTRFWANVVITALRNDAGELVGFAKVTRNLTERKRQEDDLRRANNMLRQQQSELRSLNEAKDEFVSLASHQLRTPATAVKMVLASALDELYGEIDPELHSALKKAYDSNERQINIINTLLRVAQVDSGKVVLRRAATDINAMLSEVIEEQRTAINERGQTIKLNSSRNLTAVIDRENLLMAVGNLVDNASKYSPAGTAIDVFLTKRNHHVVITVQDHGVGISPENMKLLFKKFQRIQSELSPRVPGSGLGLFWSKKIIELHGGTIQVQSKLGKGTTFEVCIPQEPADA